MVQYNTVKYDQFMVGTVASCDDRDWTLVLRSYQVLCPYIYSEDQERKTRWTWPRDLETRHMSCWAHTFLCLDNHCLKTCFLWLHNWKSTSVLMHLIPDFCPQWWLYVTRNLIWTMVSLATSRGNGYKQKQRLPQISAFWFFSLCVLLSVIYCSLCDCKWPELMLLYNYSSGYRVKQESLCTSKKMLNIEKISWSRNF